MKNAMHYYGMHGSTFSNRMLKKVIGNFPAKSLKNLFLAGCIPYSGKYNNGD
jgi:hypothetical protein